MNLKSLKLKVSFYFINAFTIKLVNMSLEWDIKEDEFVEEELWENDWEDDDIEDEDT